MFEGDNDCPRDEDAANLWRAQGAIPDHVFYLPKKHNWWGPAGVTGPCGPDSEMFMDHRQGALRPGLLARRAAAAATWKSGTTCSCSMNKQADGTFIPLKQKNVDTGMGLERTYCVLKGVKSVYDTEIFAGIIGKIEELSGRKYGESEDVTKSIRIISDHMRTSTFIIGDDRGVTPSNVDQGYVLRRLIRRAVRHGMKLDLPEGFTCEIAKVIIDQYKKNYPELDRNSGVILEQLKLEEERFQRTLKKGQAEFEKVLGNMKRRSAAFEGLRAGLTPESTAAALKLLPPSPENLPMIEKIKAGTITGADIDQLIAGCTTIDGRSAFKLYDTYGFPIEITCEMAEENGVKVDVEGFHERFKKHQETSHAGAEQRFKGGLADASEETAKLHTATHLLQAALRKVLGPEVHQKGSNITAERLRFDFSFGRKMTDEEKAEVERLVNEAIQANVPVVCEEMTVADAKAQGAMGLFESKYGERVKVYTMGQYSKEICGGPHASNTGDLKSFKIKKEEASSAGVRRIKAVIGNK